MPLLDASNASRGFVYDAVAFGAPPGTEIIPGWEPVFEALHFYQLFGPGAVSATSTEVVWLTSGGTRAVATGTNLFYDPRPLPEEEQVAFEDRELTRSSGDVVQLTFDYDDDSPSAPDVVIAGYLFDELNYAMRLPDYLQAAGGVSSISGSAHDDLLRFDKGSFQEGATIDAALGDGDDFISNARGVVFGGSGNDTIAIVSGWDGGSNSRIYGEDGDDYLVGSADEMYGGADNDIFEINSSIRPDATLSGGAGTDTLRVAGTANQGEERLDLRAMTLSGFEILSSDPEPDINWEPGQTGYNHYVLRAGQLAAMGPVTLSSQAERVFRVEIDMDDLTAFDLATATTYGSWQQAEGDIVVIIGDGDAEEISGSAWGESISGNGGDDTLVGGANGDTIDGGAGDDLIIAGDSSVSDGADIARGGDGNDTLVGGYYLDTLEGGAGDDEFRIFADDRADVVDGGPGTDWLNLAAAFHAFDVNLRDGTWTWRTLSDPFVPITGIERVTGSPFDDFLLGGDADETLEGGEGADTIEGGDGNDLILAGTPSFFDGNDIGRGGRGNDTLAGGNGRDTLEGGEGDDLFLHVNFDLNDDIDGGPGFDTLDLSGAAQSFAVNLDLGTWDNGTGFGVTTSITGVEAVRGTTGVDTLTGNGDDNLFEGGDGADVIAGGDGMDFVSYASSPTFVNLSLLTGYIGGGTDHHATGDSWSGIENLEGSAHADRLNGDNAQNVLRGLGGADRLDGNGGLDIASYLGSPSFVNVSLATGFTGGGADNHAAGDIFEQIEGLEGSAHDDILSGDAGANLLRGADGDDRLRGRAGPDTLAGGPGQDVADYSESPSFVNLSLLTGFIGGGTGHHALGDNWDEIEGFTGSRFADRLNGDNGDNLLEGGAGADTLAGNGGTDTAGYTGSAAFVNVSLLTGFAGGGTGNHASGDILSGIENLAGSPHDDILSGDHGANLLDGAGGDDTLRGRDGGDTLLGGAGTDTLTYDASPGWVNVSLQTGFTGVGAGNHAAGDTFSGIENLTGSAESDILSGDAGANRLEGAGGDDTLRGGAGADTLLGGAGRDTASYATSEGWVNVSLLTGFTGGGAASHAVGDVLDGLENIVGSGFADILNGDDADNVLEGGPGADTLRGNDGSDTASYAGAAGGVMASLATDSGLSGEAAGDVLLDIENLHGSAHADGLTGDAAANKLEGAGGDDVIEGGAGGDTMQGGAGIDTLSYAASADWVNVSLLTGFAGGGGGSHALGDEISGFENLLGSDFDDRLNGDDGDNSLTGGLGADTLIGNDGHDTADYRESDAGITVSLLTGIATGGHAEGDVLTGIEAVLGTDFSDRLTGDAADNLLAGGTVGDSFTLPQRIADLLEGGAGADTLDGGVGNDTASYATSTAPVVVSLATGTGGGVAGSHSFGDVLIGIENLHGSAFGDLLTGDAGDNGFTGGAGADTIIGNGGMDAVSYAGSDAGVSVSLVTGLGSGGHAEGDELTGIARLFGSSHADDLTGDSGENIFDAGAGNDTLTGGAGADTFVFRPGHGSDTITDFQDGIDFLVFTGSSFIDFTENVYSSSGADALVTNPDFGTITLTGMAGLINLNDFGSLKVNMPEFF